MLLLALGGCVGCASHIEPTVVPDRAVPSVTSVADVRACWVEYASTFGFTASGIVIHHPQGLVVIDVGQSKKFTSEIGER